MTDIETSIVILLYHWNMRSVLNSKNAIDNMQKSLIFSIFPFKYEIIFFLHTKEIQNQSKPEGHHEMYVSESVVAYRIKTQKSIVAVHLNDLLMVTRVTYMNDFQVNLYIEKCSEP